MAGLEGSHATHAPGEEGADMITEYFQSSGLL